MSIKRDIYVQRNTLKSPIEISEGTNAIEIELILRDYQLTESAAAVVYSMGIGKSEAKRLLAEVVGNSVKFTPVDGFFDVGLNVLQVRIIDDEKVLISFQETVKCSGRMNFGDEVEEKQQTLIEQILIRLASLASLQNQITEVDERLGGLEHMTIHNDFTAPIALEGAETILLTDDFGNAIVADWKYKEE